MKTAGIIFLVLAGVAFAALIAAASQGSEVGIQRMLNALLVNGVIGVVCLSVAKRRQREDDERNRWKDGK